MGYLEEMLRALAFGDFRPEANALRSCLYHGKEGPDRFYSTSHQEIIYYEQGGRQNDSDY